MTTIDSPCVRNCCLDDDDICVGCFRSLAEIMQWGGASDELKRHILGEAGVRRAKQEQRRAAYEKTLQEGPDQAATDFTSVK